MTREEAVLRLEVLKDFSQNNESKNMHGAIDMAIRSLEAWDKVFDELYENIGTTNTLYSKEWNDAFDVGCQFALMKINKHLKEVADE